MIKAALKWLYMEKCNECSGDMEEVFEEKERKLCKHCFFKIQQDSMQNFLVKDAFASEK